MHIQRQIFCFATVALLFLLGSVVHAQGNPDPNNPYNFGKDRFTTTDATGTSVQNFFPSNIPNNNDDYSYNIPPFYFDPTGLQGASQVIRAQGQFMKDAEMARIMRERAKQAYLETKKARFDLEQYIRENTPTYTDEQVKVVKETLERIQQDATPTEISNGKALNVLLKDLSKLRVKAGSISTNSIHPNILQQINVTFGDNGNLGILRGGNLEIPVALQEESIVPKQVQKDITFQAKTLYEQASRGNIEAAVLKDLRNNLEMIRENLSKNVNNIPTRHYIQGNRFLNHFNEALRALETNNFATKVNKYQEFVQQGRKLDEFVGFMVDNGLSFAGATPGDEAAYEAIYNQMVNLDIALNAQFAKAQR